MSRPLRIEWAGGPYHVTSRGDRREAIVEDDADRRARVRVLGECCERFDWRKTDALLALFAQRRAAA